jgi:hypothetical protein
MATITVRALGPNNEPQCGNGLQNFLTDSDAVTQIIMTRLRLFQGEWFLNLLDGLPMFQSMLGSSASSENLQIITNLISERITGTPFVTGIVAISATFNNRQFVFQATVSTQFGTTTIGNSPGSTATIS